MLHREVFLFAFFAVASCMLPDKRRCDPEPQIEMPTVCSNYKNILHLENMLREAEEKMRILVERVDNMEVFLESEMEIQLNNTVAKLEAKMMTAQAVRHVAFSASLVESGEIFRGPSDDRNLVFKRILSNTGAYDSNTGMFTAPVDGLYYFSFSTYGFNTHAIGAILVKNGVGQISTFERNMYDGSDSSSNAAVLQLAAGDSVHMRLWEKGRVYDNQHGHTVFSGFLVCPCVE